MTQDTPTAVEPADQAAVTAHRRRGMLFLCLAVAGVGFAMSVQQALNSNFVADEMNLTGLQQGVLEGFRESCGIIALGVLAVLAGLAEPLIGSAMLVLLAVGISAYTLVGDYAWLIVASLVWSQGLHVWMPLPNSMALALAEPGRAGRQLGRVAAAGAVGAGMGLVVALVLDALDVRIRPLYLLAGVAAVLAAGACLGIPRKIKTPGPRWVLRRKYWLYYLLCFLEGWRKQIVLAFAGYLLVKVHHTPLRTMLLLWIVVQTVGWIASPLAGRLIDRVGERKVLLVYYASLTVCFLGYALVEDKIVLYAVFLVDSTFFVLSMALTTYVNRIAPKSEHTPTLSMGVAMNHVSAVTMPVVGGLLWNYAGYQWTFGVGAAVAAASVLGALCVPPHKVLLAQTPAEPVPPFEQLRGGPDA